MVQTPLRVNSRVRECGFCLPIDANDDTGAQATEAEPEQNTRTIVTKLATTSHTFEIIIGEALV